MGCCLECAAGAGRGKVPWSRQLWEGTAVEAATLMILSAWSGRPGLIKLCLRTATDCGRIGKRKVQLKLMQGVGVGVEVWVEWSCHKQLMNSWCECKLFRTQRASDTCNGLTHTRLLDSRPNQARLQVRTEYSVLVGAAAISHLPLLPLQHVACSMQPARCDWVLLSHLCHDMLISHEISRRRLDRWPVGHVWWFLAWSQHTHTHSGTTSNVQCSVEQWGSGGGIWRPAYASVCALTSTTSCMSQPRS